MRNISNADKEQLMHKLYKTLTVLPLSSLMTEDNLKTVVLKTTKNIVTNDDGSTYVDIKRATFNNKAIKESCEYFRPLSFTPILVNHCVDGSYYIVHGWDRLLAADSMGWTTIPCYVIQIPCGDEFIIDNGEEWECNGGLYQYSDILTELMFPGDDLLKILG